MMDILKIVWTAMNSPLGITVVAGIFFWLLNRLYSSKPSWSKFEGSIIAGVRFAEKNIPDDTGSSGLAKLDSALQYVLRIYEEKNGKVASKKVVAELKEGIQYTHNKLDVIDKLSGK